MTSLADFLSVHRDALVERFKARVEQTLAPRGLSSSELEDHLPDFLEAVTEAIRDDAWPPARVFAHDATAEQHGRQRLRVGFDLDALTREYGLLRDCIFELLEEQGVMPSLRELRILSDCVSAATADSVTQYVAYSQGRQREGEERLQAIIDNAPAAIYVTDVEGRCLVANRRLESIFGLSKEAILGRTDYERLPKEVADVTRGNDRRVLAENRPLQVEEVIPQADGLHTYISLKFPLHDAEGRPNAVGGISTDITERIQAQQALRETQQRLRTVLSHLPVILWAIDARGVVTLMEGKGVERAGLKADTFVGQSLFELFQGMSWVVTNVRRALAGEEFVAEEEGEGRWFEVHYIPHRSAAGVVEGAMGLTLDVTERKRTQDFQQRLLGIVGHDIRNPISAISLSAVTLLKQEGLPQGYLRPLQRIASSADRIEKLVATLLDFTRVQFGQPLPLQYERVVLGTLAEQVCDEVRGASPRARVELTVTGDTRGAWDPGRLMQVMGNLLTNALRHGQPEAPVRVSCQGEEGAVTFEVHNEGAPIPEAVQAQLFKPFRGGEQARAHAREGLGLGLYIVREIVTAHGGTVTFESTAERGTTFTVRLPREPVAGA
ncbi:PAS domain-containing protein [Hyalangium gracile]|uniref:PAS domain-containing protein n=1 Tax=Hyalangium gracile TaxID=394092 RepID=UPI001CCAAE64|nr:PAS domain-containing protein [Hyalangium gracile]